MERRREPSGSCTIEPNTARIAVTRVEILGLIMALDVPDRIVVLEDGQVAEDGPHSVLLRQNGLYARFWARQSGGFIGLEEDAAE